MSKFIEKLNKLSRGETQAMGFTARASVSLKPKIQVVARLDAEKAESLSSHVAGADIGLLGISKAAVGAETLKKLSQSLPEVIWGAWLQNGGETETKQLTKAGCDFIVFPAEGTPVTFLKEDKETGKVIMLESSLTEGLIRTANELPVDAVFVDGDLKENQVLSFGQMMLFTRFAAMLNKPLLVPVPSTVTAGELASLWEAGISAVVIDIEAKQPADLLIKLRQEIDNTEFLSRRSRRGDAVVPRVKAPAETTTEEEGE